MYQYEIFERIIKVVKTVGTLNGGICNKNKKYEVYYFGTCKLAFGVINNSI